MEDRDILIKWHPFKEKIKTRGHQMSDGWWYVYTPFDKKWHFVPNEDVEICEKQEKNNSHFEEMDDYLDRTTNV